VPFCHHVMLKNILIVDKRKVIFVTKCGTIFVSGKWSLMSSWLTCVIGMERQEAEAPDTTYSHELDNLQFYLKFCFLWQIFRDRPNLKEKLHIVLPPVNRILSNNLMSQIINCKY